MRLHLVLRRDRHSEMFSNLCLCYVLSVTLFTIMGGERASCSEYEYDTKTTETSFKKFNEQLISIELLCDGHDTLLCEDFKCLVYPSSQDDGFWLFKSCAKLKCDLKPIETSSAMDIRVSSDITFNRLESRIDTCTTQFHRTKIDHINNNERHLLDVVDETYTYEFFRYLQEVRVIWSFVLNGYPQQLRLLPNNTAITSPEKYEYEVFENNQGILLRIKNFTDDDFETPYYFSATNEFETRTFFLNYIEYFLERKKITVHELTETYSIVNCTAVVYFHYKFSCDISWRLKNCSQCPYIEISDSQSVITKEYLQCTSSLKIDSFTSGTVECIIAYESDIDRVHQKIDNIKESVDIFIDATDTNESPEQFEGEYLEPLVLTCRASALNHTAHIQWAFKNLEDNIDHPEFVSETQNNVFSYQKTLQLPRLRSYNGEYFCKTVLKNGTIEYKSIDVNMTAKNIHNSSLRHGFITDANETTKQFESTRTLLKPIVLKCKASVLNITQEIRLTTSDLEQNISDFRISKQMQEKAFGYQKFFLLSGAGLYNFSKYVCKALLHEHKTRNVTFEGNKNWIYYAVALFLITVVAIAIFIGIKIRKNQILQKQVEELHLVELANFEKGALEHLNPNLTIDDQADLLPYDKRYEFPIEKLQLGEQIGSGAFGVVIKGEATGILENELNTTVAIKMVNRNIGDVYIKALASELKIMIHLGKHVNIVNLLGACTKHIIKRELLVISEYCRFGNLKDYLLHHRQTFVDQINTETGQIDWSIGEDVREVNKPELITPCFANRFYTGAKTSSTSKEIDTSCTQQSGDTLHYKGDYFNINKPVCTRDLLLWSFQVARGMEYLSFRKVLHGDLAARNILLTDDNVVKICDFGLSKSMYRKDVYKKTGDEILPVKWMAIEAITDKIFSVQSDVWSFGIVLWEIFSLASTPYPGMEYNEVFYEKLLDGYRMKSPQYATERIYEIMLHCWDADPTERPSFSQLVQTIGSILEDKIRNHYIDMNSGYIKMNAQRFLEQNSDYMSMVSSPDIKSFSSPNHYANVLKSTDEHDTYL